MKKCPLLILIPSLFLLIFSCEDERTIVPVNKRKDKAFQLYEKSRQTKDIDTKLSFLKSSLSEISTPSDTLKAHIYDHLLYYYNRENKPDSSIYYADLRIKDGLYTKDTLEVAKGFYRKARSFKLKNDEINVLKNTFQSQKYYLLAGDSLNAGKRLLELSIAQTRLGDFPGSQNSAVKAISLLENSPDSLYIASSYNNLAATYRKLNDLDESIEEYNNALKFFNSRKDSLVVLNNIAKAYADKKEYGRSLAIFDSILPLAEDTSTTNRIKSNLYFTRWLNNGANVTDSLRSVMEARRRNKDLIGLLSSYDHLTRVNENISREESLKYAKSYYETARRLNSANDEIAALVYLVRLAPLREANSFAREYIRLNDSVMTARNKVQNVFAKIRFDEEKKLEEIDQLENLSSQQQLELLERRNERNIATLMGVLLFGGVLIIYYFLRQRHKKERIREIHATESRISKRIHDELANDVYNVMNELENSANLKKEAILNKLDSIYARTRNISRENTPVSTSSNYQEELYDMISQSIPVHAKLYLLGFNDVSWSKITAESKIVIHRVLQELMVNMKKHSEASIVSLNFKESASKLRISYNDNGKGISSSDSKKGGGLQNVENRIETIGGSVNFQTENNTGFSAQIIIPF